MRGEHPADAALREELEERDIRLDDELRAIEQRDRMERYAPPAWSPIVVLDRPARPRSDWDTVLANLGDEWRYAESATLARRRRVEAERRRRQSRQAWVAAAVLALMALAALYAATGGGPLGSFAG